MTLVRKMARYGLTFLVLLIAIMASTTFRFPNHFSNSSSKIDQKIKGCQGDEGCESFFSAVGEWLQNEAHANPDAASGRRGGVKPKAGKPGAKEQTLEDIRNLKLDKDVKEAFHKAMKDCGCEGFANMGTERAVNANFGVQCSCHKAGPPTGPLAIDVGKLKCGGKDVAPEPGTNPAYQEKVKCMLESMSKDSGKKMNIIYGTTKPAGVPEDWVLDPTGKHNDHMHFQQKGCGDVVRKQGRCGGKFRPGAGPVEKAPK